MVFWWQFIGILCFRGNNPIRYHGTKLGLLNNLACVGSVSARVRRQNWDKSEKKKKIDGGGGGEKWKRCFLFSSSPLSLPLPPFFFCSRSNFRAVTRLETLATQARERADCKQSLVDAVYFFLLVQYNLTCTWFEVASNKNHTIFRDEHGIRES